MLILIHGLKFHSIPAEHRGNRDILVVALRLSGSWLAKMGLIAGRGEWWRVVESGRTVRESLARQLFPEFREIAYEST